MTVQDAVQIFKNMANFAVLPQSSKKDHEVIQEAIETLEAHIKVDETKKMKSKKEDTIS